MSSVAARLARSVVLPARLAVPQRPSSRSHDLQRKQEQQQEHSQN